MNLNENSAAISCPDFIFFLKGQRPGLNQVRIKFQKDDDGCRLVAGSQQSRGNRCCRKLKFLWIFPHHTNNSPVKAFYVYVYIVVTSINLKLSQFEITPKEL